MKCSYYVGNLYFDEINGIFENGMLYIEFLKEIKKEFEKCYLEFK